VARRYEFYVGVARTIWKRVRYCSCHENIKFISSTKWVMFFLLYKHADDAIFPKISDHFPKIFEDFPKLLRRPDERFRAFSAHFLKISEDCPRRPKKIRRCFDHTPTNLSVVKETKEKCYQTRYLHMWGYIFTCEDILFLSICYHSVYHWLEHNKIGYLYKPLIISKWMIYFDSNWNIVIILTFACSVKE